VDGQINGKAFTPSRFPFSRSTEDGSAEIKRPAATKGKKRLAAFDSNEAQSVPWHEKTKG